MPPVILAIAGLLEAIFTGLSAAWATFIASTLLSIGGSLVLGEISKLLTKSASSSSLSTSAASRTVTSRQAIAPRRVLYGSNRVAGIITFIGTTGATNQKLDLGLMGC